MRTRRTQSALGPLWTTGTGPAWSLYQHDMSERFCITPPAKHKPRRIQPSWTKFPGFGHLPAPCKGGLSVFQLFVSRPTFQTVRPWPAFRGLAFQWCYRGVIAHNCIPETFRTHGLHDMQHFPISRHIRQMTDPLIWSHRRDTGPGNQYLGIRNPRNLT